MRFLLLIICIASILPHKVLAQKKVYHRQHAPYSPNFDHALQLEEKSDTTANVSFGDFDGDGHLDIVLVKGRHWPITDRILLGDGKGGFRKTYNLGTVSDRSYTGSVADFNGDGFPDIAVSNDAPDSKLIYINNGKGILLLALNSAFLTGQPGIYLWLISIKTDFQILF